MVSVPGFRHQPPLDGRRAGGVVLYAGRVRNAIFEPAPTAGLAVTRLGGQPSWLVGPAWPLSTELGVPMRFVGQVQLRSEPLTLAYVFMTADDEYVEDTWVPDGGENAVVIQPGAAAPAGVVVSVRATGPTLEDDEGAPVELVVRPVNGPADDGAVDENAVDETAVAAARTSGDPQWVQQDEHPGPGWHLALQVDSAAVPAFLNFGDSGVGYVFVTDDLSRGVFLWQGA